ncbi:hypothetical protein MKX01_037402 [Papaver californicum]|nr:hypothetical protein MKX01_037402 [Papaver californicum]
MKKNNFTKGRFLLCFRPVVMENRTIKSSKSENIFESMVSEKENSKEKTSNPMRKVKSARNLLCKVAKAVFLDTSMKKKSRNGKVVQDPNRSQREIFSEKLQKISILPETKSKVEEEKNNKNQTRNLDLLSSSVSSSSSTLTYSSSILSSSPTSSSSSSSSTSTWSIPPHQESSESKSSSWITFSGRDKSFRINSLDRKERKTDDTKSSSNFYYICGLCLLLFSLSVLIFCGKVCAILCTSTWFYFVSTTSRPHIEEFSGSKSSSSTLEMEEEDIRSKHEKKKVIMERFLGRNNNHHKFLSLQH